MTAAENVINDLNIAKFILCNQQMLNPEMCIRIGQAISAAIDLLGAQPQWTSVEDGLPKKDGRYLVCDGGDVLEACFSLIGQLRRPEWDTTDCYESESLDHVTHWMPKPKPPEGVNDNAESRKRSESVW